jgi:hypothetical protein
MSEVERWFSDYIDYACVANVNEDDDYEDDDYLWDDEDEYDDEDEED